MVVMVVMVVVMVVMVGMVWCGVTVYWRLEVPGVKFNLQVWIIRSSPRCRRLTSPAAGRWLGSTTPMWGAAVRSSMCALLSVRDWLRGSAFSVLMVT